ncbi:hypothetical protein EIK77_004484 [Talaromyces pinophilus]|nr:hypothetical protein EIK77_004484 [Talaromyces pinophilus]PCG89451.1 Hypothetical protein PENO1_104540 [Penicillium occitanis (nom. inval.)]PCG89797.1 hypothetical protein PENOC_104910 [Penicillium occitanis (nom. inval.)]
MPLGDMIDDPTSNDEYVAQLLASEAKDKSLKYSALGLKAYLPRRPTDRAPKPNTRFLKNILRDTDTHNAALRRKEEEDSRERMRKLRGERSPPSRRERRGEKDRYRDRSPRRREKERSSRREHVDDSSNREHHKSRSERHRRRYEDDSESDQDRETSSRSHRRHRDDERRSKRSRRESSRNRSSRHSKKNRSASPRRSRSPDVPRRDRDDHRDDERRRRDDDRPTEDHTAQLESRKDTYSSDNESDPLEDLVGPLPPSARAVGVSTRGRGSYRQNTSNIDSHFERDYNPKLDVDLSDNDETTSSKRSTRRPVAGLMTQDEDKDWNMALEALRDRAAWRQKGEERLRAAGFDESTVLRWKEDPAFANGSSNNDTEGRIEDVKWAKKGEGREWDRGKVLNEHGHYDVKGQW